MFRPWNTKKKTIFSISRKKRPHEPLSSKGGEGYPNLSDPLQKKNYVCLPLSHCAFMQICLESMKHGC